MGETHVVFGASGGAGGAVVRARAAAGKRVRAVTRRHGGEWPRGVEHATADGSDPDAARSACVDAAVVYHCANVPYTEWEATLPPLMDGIIAGAESAGAALVYCDNLYMYGAVDGPISEDSPMAATGPKGRLRIELADTLLEAHAAGRVRAVIARGSDFYGPGAANTVAGRLVFPAVAADRRAHWLGDLDQPHSLNYIDDFARDTIRLALDPRAAGGVWHLPAGPAPTGREFVEMAFAAATRPPRVGVYRTWAIRLLSLFNAEMRELSEVLYQFQRPFVIDSSRFEETFGGPGPTPMPDAIGRTLEVDYDVTSALPG
jgi:nucleoside-diphosphate-sugar epimerase